MADLSDLEFVKKVPAVKTARTSVSPLERACTKLLGDIDAQIALARDPEFVIRKDRKKHDGTIETIERKPKSWIVTQGDEAYITVRYSNKPMPLGGKRGSVIRCPADRVEETLQRVRDHVASGDADPLIEKMMKEAKRKPRQQTAPASPAPSATVGSISY